MKDNQTEFCPRQIINLTEKYQRLLKIWSVDWKLPGNKITNDFKTYKKIPTHNNEYIGVLMNTKFIFKNGRNHFYFIARLCLWQVEMMKCYGKRFYESE